MMDNTDQYFLATYFAVTTMTTVGYGDMSANTSVERGFCIVLMVIGVVCFTFISGSLSSVLSNYDSTNASL
jgi:uncharacterized PurR-regulated membrane protein YhhQ (DUF165 family)